MIDIHEEKLLTVSCARDWVRDRTGMEFSRNTIYNWAARGVRGRLLETIRVGGVIFTSVEALERWITSNPRVGYLGRPSGHSAKMAVRRAEELFG